MKILAILQNQWFKNPLRAEATMAHVGRERFIKVALFFGCLTGRRLKAALGEDLCDAIVWEEASRQIGGMARAAFPPDPQHIADTIKQHKPDVVLTFGKIAGNGLELAVPLLQGSDCCFVHFAGPHPAARHATVVQELASVAAKLRIAMGQGHKHPAPQGAGLPEAVGDAGRGIAPAAGEASSRRRT